VTAGLEGIDIYSGVGVFTGEGFCRIEAVLTDGTRVTGQLSPDEVRQMALGWLQAAEAAEHDAAVLAELTETLGLTHEVAGSFLLGLRERRTSAAAEPGADQ
jgi:hypothetical protein